MIQLQKNIVYDRHELCVGKSRIWLTIHRRRKDDTGWNRTFALRWYFGHGILTSSATIGLELGWFAIILWEKRNHV